MEAKATLPHNVPQFFIADAQGIAIRMFQST